MIKTILIYGTAITVGIVIQNKSKKYMVSRGVNPAVAELTSRRLGELSSRITANALNKENS